MGAKSSFGSQTKRSGFDQISRRKDLDLPSPALVAKTEVFYDLSECRPTQSERHSLVKDSSSFFTARRPHNAARRPQARRYQAIAVATARRIRLETCMDGEKTFNELREILRFYRRFPT
jgi:hypothetical protein